MSLSSPAPYAVSQDGQAIAGSRRFPDGQDRLFLLGQEGADLERVVPFVRSERRCLWRCAGMRLACVGAREVLRPREREDDELARTWGASASTASDERDRAAKVRWTAWRARRCRGKRSDMASASVEWWKCEPRLAARLSSNWLKLSPLGHVSRPRPGVASNRPAIGKSLGRESCPRAREQQPQAQTVRTEV
jgi:hypothetical protein